MFAEQIKVGIGAAITTLLIAVAGPLVSSAVLFTSTRLVGVPFTDHYVALALVAALLCFIFMRSLTAESQGTFLSGWTIARRTALAWIGVLGVLLLIGYATKVSTIYSRRALFVWFLLTPPLLIGALIVLRLQLRQIVISAGRTRSAIIAGVNTASRQLAESIQARPELGLEVKGFFDDRSAERLDIDPDLILGHLDDIDGYVKQARIDTIFLAIPLGYMQRTKELLDRLRDTTASLYFVPDIFVFDLIQARTSDVNGIPIVALCETPFRGSQALIKRASDVVLALLMLTIAFPIMLGIAVLIKLTSPGKVIFRQRRYGLDGEQIVIYKFRTMTVAEDGPEIPQATINDSRVTPLGRILRRYSLDELPQLFNVLQGRMSMVGPRPHAVAHNEEYRRLITGYMVRHKVAPGITGLAQINGCRGETKDVEDMQKRVHYDLEYLRHWSLFLDLKILVRTLGVWFRDENAY